MRLRVVLTVAAVVTLSMLGCAQEDPPTSPGFTLPPASTPPATVPDATGAEPDVVLTGVPQVTLIGIAELPDHPGLLCANSMTVIVEAKDIDGLELILVLDHNGLWPIDVTATPRVQDEDDPNRWFITLDLGPYAGPVVDPDASPGLMDGDSVTLIAAAVVPGANLGDFELPTDEGLSDALDFVFDDAAPEVAISDPTTQFGPPTLTGLSLIAGVVTETQALDAIDVFFNGEVIASFQPNAGGTGDQNYTFEEEIDLRSVKGSVDLLPLAVSARDACGNEGEVSLDAKLLTWPWVRLPELVTVDGGKVVDSALADCDGDTYPDMFVGGAGGVQLARNRGEQAPGQFEKPQTLLSAIVTAMAVKDIDADGDLDLIVTVAGPALRLYRNIDEQGACNAASYRLEEEYDLPVSDSSEIVRIIVADMTNNAGAGSDVARDDVVVITGASGASVLLFKRQNPDQPSPFDSCVEVEVSPESVEGEGDAGSTVVGTELVCPKLFSEAVKAGGVDGATWAVAEDVVGISGDYGPDGYPDIVMAAGLNQISVFPNRYQIEETVDTVFNQAKVSYVWPVDSTTGVNVEHFCLANLIETNSTDDPLDLFAGTGKGGFSTWRVLKGERAAARRGYFSHDADPDDPQAFDPQEMVGAGGGAQGIVCGDLDQDGYQDVVMLNGDLGIMQVLLGNGLGRFNQVPPAPGQDAAVVRKLMNPLNESMGFNCEDKALKPVIADVDGDGLPDVVVVHTSGLVSVYRNLTSETRGFDLAGTRLLVAPAPRAGNRMSDISVIGIADLDADGKAEIVGVSDKLQLKTNAFMGYHKNLMAYRALADKLEAGNGNILHAWRAGTNGASIPSYPAAFDFIGPELYVKAYAPVVSPDELTFLDLSNDMVWSSDGYPDLVLTGTGDSSVAVIANVERGDFWRTSGLTGGFDGLNTMFHPMDGKVDIDDATKVEFISPTQNVAIPHLVTGTGPLGIGDFEEAECIGQALRICAWDSNNNVGTADEAAYVPFWVCALYENCDAVQGFELGGPVQALRRVAVNGPEAGNSTSNPSVEADLHVLSSGSNSITTFPWSGADVTQPYGAGQSRVSGGADPNSFDFRDLNDDGLTDFAVATKDNVLISFGDPGGQSAQTPIDKDADVTQNSPSELRMVDMNDDGAIDVVFLEPQRTRLVTYLNTGLDTATNTRQFHGPIYTPTCASPQQLLEHDFDGDTRCPTLVVLCADGVIAMLENQTCERLSD